MTRRQGAILNTIAAFSNEIVSIVAGFIVPRIILSAFGSNVNGLVTSIAQFLGFVSLLEAGVGAVIKSSLYKPLASGDTVELSCVLKSSQRFFRAIAYVLIVYTLVLVVVFPLLINNQFGFLYTGSLILIISASLFSQYYFGITNQLLLIADQKAYIPLFLTVSAIVLNTIACIVVVRLGGGIHSVRIATAVFFTIKPILLFLYVRSHYSIDPKVIYDKEPIKQKWNGLAQHIAMLGQDNAPAIILTMFSSLANVSIYGVYILVINGIRQLINTINSSIGPIMGELIAKKENDTLNNMFSLMEWGLHNIIVVLYTVTGLLIVPFVLVYTSGVFDTDYNVPLFALFLTLAGALRSLQLCYNILIQAAGLFKETQTASFIELFLNIGVSILLVLRYGLVGVAIGMSVALCYRLLYFVIFLSKNVLRRSISCFVRQVAVDFVIIGLIIVSCSWLPQGIDSYWVFFYKGAITLSIATSICLAVNMVLYRSNVRSILKYLSLRMEDKKNVSQSR